jgi:hypothetical protein
VYRLADPTTGTLTAANVGGTELEAPRSAPSGSPDQGVDRAPAWRLLAQRTGNMAPVALRVRSNRRSPVAPRGDANAAYKNIVNDIGIDRRIRTT